MKLCSFFSGIFPGKEFWQTFSVGGIFMPDISIRKFTDEQYALIKARAVQEGQSMEAWVKDLILQAAINPPASLSPEARKAWIKQKARRMQAAVEMREAEAEMQRIETELFQPAAFMVGTDENEKD